MISSVPINDLTLKQCNVATLQWCLIFMQTLIWKCHHTSEFFLLHFSSPSPLPECRKTSLYMFSHVGLPIFHILFSIPFIFLNIPCLCLRAEKSNYNSHECFPFFLFFQYSLPLPGCASASLPPTRPWFGCPRSFHAESPWWWWWWWWWKLSVN